jgi:hypothetical protein
VPRTARGATVPGVARVRLVSSLWLAACLLTRPAEAVLFQDSRDHFRLDFRPQQTRVCVLVPAADTKTEDCAGLDLETLRRLYAGGPDLRGAVAVVRGETAYNLLYAVQTPGIPSATPASAGEFARGLVGAARSAAPAGQVVREKNPAAPFALDRYGRAQVIRVDLVFERMPLAGGPPEVQEQTTFAILGNQAVHSLYLVAPRELAAEAQHDVVSALAHVEIEPPRSREYRLGRALGRAMAPLFGVAVLGAGLVGAVLAVVLWWRRTARRKV